jgi:hypothetical protein
LPSWHGNGLPPPAMVAGPPPGLGAGPVPLRDTGPPLNGINHHLGHPPTFHAPYNPLPQPNGYAPFSGPPVHPQLPPAPHRGPYGPPSAGGPPPLHLSNGNGMMVNGMHSPRMPYSPTRPHGHHSSRSTESPFSGPPPLPQYPTMHHGSPAPGSLNRPSTPRDTMMRDAPPPAMPPEPRANTGASASPSLRNLLH